jgi:serine O-acetyltransferase
LINLTANNRNYIYKPVPDKLPPVILTFGAKKEKSDNTKTNKISKKVLIGASIATGGFLVDLFAAKGKISSKLTGGKVSFVKTMSEEMDNVLKQDTYALKNRAEAFLTVPGLQAVWNHRVINKLHEWKVPVIPRLLANISRFVTGIEIHPGAKLGKNIFFDHTGAIVGETAKIGNNVTIIGRTVLGSTGKDGFLRHTVVEDGVTIGMNSTMLGRINLGKNSKIGAGAVVTHNVPEGATVIGNPAKIIAINDKKLNPPISLKEFKETGERT